VLAFLPASKPPQSYNLVAAAFASAATVVLFLSASNSAADAARGRGNATAIEYARYLLPPLPHKAPQAGHESIHWVEPAPVPSILPGMQSLAKVAARLHSRIGQGAPPPVKSPAMIEASEFATPQRVYVESELDRPVVRDPLSAAPEYPPNLEKARIEGVVAVSFVVDSMGFADSTSLQIVNVSNIDFAESVRHALPLMRFTPAELSGRHVPQRVYQQFKFVLPQTASNPRRADSASKSVDAR
jgi:hypothetical protein